MNNFVVLSIALVVFTYYGDKYVPTILKDNKQMLLGVVVGLLLCTFFKTDSVEGYFGLTGGEDRYGIIDCRSKGSGTCADARAADDQFPSFGCWDTREECHAGSLVNAAEIRLQNGNGPPPKGFQYEWGNG
jgi:hypothetical protein